MPSISDEGRRLMMSQETLRLHAIRRDIEASKPFELGRLWQELCRGAWLFHDMFSTDERYLAVIQPAEPSTLRPVDLRKLQVLEGILLGTPPKVIAIESGRSLSSVTTNVQECLRSMGLRGRVGQASVLLTMAARALHRPGSAPQYGRSSDLEFDGQTYLVVSVLRPDLRFPVPLSAAETAVLRSLLEGDSYAEISGARATSQRTVANQIGTAFKKLGVSGRRATIERLISHSAKSC
jgi:DNA-binding NarL/FixJ family response regulator